jgi:hypothetical protein
MASLLESMFKMSFGLTERSLLLMESSMRTLQSAIGRVAGMEPDKPPSEPPVNGPTTLDDATATLGGHLLRIAWTTPKNTVALGDVWGDLLHSIRDSFKGLDYQDPRLLATLPFQLPLSLGTLMTQQALRGLYASYVVGPEHAGHFGSYMADSFTDAHVFVSLQYKEQMRRWKEEAKERPDDADLHMKMGVTYTKMGLYPQAVEAFEVAARDEQTRAEALYLSLVASYRGGDYERALHDGRGSLSIRPDDRRTRWWSFLAAEKLGGYPADFPEDFRAEVKAGRHATKLRFEDIAPRIGLDKTSAGRGTAFFPIKGDGHLDAVISSGHAGVSVYRNNGDGTFTDITVGSGLDECVNAFAVAVGDYNNDGLDDLYVTRLGFYDGECVLFRNNGDGTFTNVTKEAGVGCWGPNFAAQWVDYDCDGHLDLFVASNLGALFNRKVPNRLFHNNGDGTFTEVAKEAGLISYNPTIGGGWGDYNNDGYPDVLLSGGIGRAQLYRNNGDGTFTDVSEEAGIGDPCFGSVAYFIDYDNDGWLDIVQYVWSPEDDVLHTLFNGQKPEGGRPIRVYRNNRNGTFTLVSDEIGIDGCWGTMSGNAGDFNNDGRMDFLLGNGDPHMDRTEPPVILECGPDGSYRNVTFTAGLPYTGKSHGGNMVDLFGDGRLSLVVASGGAYPADLLTTSVFCPKELPGNYLNVRLTGTKSNRNAIGARLKLVSEGWEQHKLVSGGSGFGCLPYEQHLGLGERTKVELLEIRWPSGLLQKLENLPSNTTIRITEGQDQWVEVYRKP